MTADGGTTETICSADLLKCFEPCIEEILKLIQTQVEGVKDKQEPEIKVSF